MLVTTVPISYISIDDYFNTDFLNDIESLINRKLSKKVIGNNINIDQARYITLFRCFSEFTHKTLNSPILSSVIDLYTKYNKSDYDITYTYYTCNNNLTLPLNYADNYRSFEMWDFYSLHEQWNIANRQLKEGKNNLFFYYPFGSDLLKDIKLCFITITSKKDKTDSNQIRIYYNSIEDPDPQQKQDDIIHILEKDESIENTLIEFNYYDLYSFARFFAKIDINNKLLQLDETKDIVDCNNLYKLAKINKR